MAKRKELNTSVATQLALIMSTLEQMVVASNTNAKDRLSEDQMGRLTYVLNTMRGPR